MEFNDYLLKLEKGQKLKILSYSPIDLIHSIKKYWDNEKKRYFITTRNLNIFEKKEHFSYSVQHYMLCEYEGKIRIIKFGKKLYDIITSYLMLNVYPYSSINPFIQFSIYLYIDIEYIQRYRNYDNSIMSHVEGTDFSLNYYNSSEYKFIIDCMDFTEERSKLSKHHDIILNLNKRGVIEDNDPLMRLLKFKKLTNA